MALIRAEVVGPFPIVDAKTGKDVRAGDDATVVLDDEVTNVPALVQAGLIAEPDVYGPPAKSASKADWVAHAVKQGMDPAEAEAATRDDLIKAHG